MLVGHRWLTNGSFDALALGKRLETDLSREVELTVAREGRPAVWAQPTHMFVLVQNQMPFAGVGLFGATGFGVRPTSTWVSGSRLLIMKGRKAVYSRPQQSWLLGQVLQRWSASGAPRFSDPLAYLPISSWWL